MRTRLLRSVASRQVVAVTAINFKHAVWERGTVLAAQTIKVLRVTTRRGAQHTGPKNDRGNAHVGAHAKLNQNLEYAYA